MIKSVGPVEFLIQLNETLPARFTLEFDVVSRNGNVGGAEFAFEGTPALSQSPRSAQVTWSHQGLAIYGGGIDREFKLPEGMGAELMGQLAEIRVAFDGPASKLLTNGEVVYDLPNLPFPRGRVLRVFMHGVDDNRGAFYLAKLRIAEGGGVTSGTIVLQAGPVPTLKAAPTLLNASPPTATPNPAPAPALLPATGPAASATPLSLAPTGVSVVPVGDLVKVSFVAVGPPGMPNPAKPTESLAGYIVERVPADKASDCPASDGDLFFDNGFYGCMRNMASADANPRWFVGDRGFIFLVRVAAVFQSQVSTTAYWSPQYSVTMPFARIAGLMPPKLSELLISDVTFVVGKTYACPDSMFYSCAEVTVSWVPMSNAVSYTVQFDKFTGTFFEPAVPIDVGQVSVAPSPAPSVIKPLWLDNDGMVLRVCVAPVFNPSALPDPRAGTCAQAVVRP